MRERAPGTHWVAPESALTQLQREKSPSPWIRKWLIRRLLSVPVRRGGGEPLQITGVPAVRPEGGLGPEYVPYASIISR